MEALASETNVLVRDIPVFDGWLVDKENCYMGHNNEQFITLIRQIINKEVPELKEAGYEVARKRSLQYIGEDLRKVYESVLKR